MSGDFYPESDEKVPIVPVKRKVISEGGNSVAVNIPKDIADFLGLKDGETVEMYVRNHPFKAGFKGLGIFMYKAMGLDSEKKKE